MGRGKDGVNKKRKYSHWVWIYRLRSRLMISLCTQHEHKKEGYLSLIECFNVTKWVI